MSWIEFHPDELLELQKFQDFRAELSWSENEALGFLGRFWGKVLKLRESGDISGWRADYVVAITGSRAKPEKLWKAMGVWLDQRNGKVLVHDWLEYAGRYLVQRYKTRNPEKIKELWALHGRVYGQMSLPVGSDREVTGKPTLPYLPNLTKPDLPSDQGQARHEGEKQQPRPTTASGRCQWKDHGVSCSLPAEERAVYCRAHLDKAMEVKSSRVKRGGGFQTPKDLLRTQPADDGLTF